MPVLARIICRWVPSAQSNRINSPSRFTRTAEGFLSGVGSDPAVPRKVTLSIIGLVWHFAADDSCSPLSSFASNYSLNQSISGLKEQARASWKFRPEALRQTPGLR